MTTEQFNEKWTPEPFSGCWLWIGRINSRGYGQVNPARNQSQAAHRLSWQLHKGEIPSGFQVLHRCDTRPCVNPDHLFLGNNAINTRDKALKGRGTTRLTVQQVAEVKTSNLSSSELARKFGVYPSTISDIRRGITWRELSGV